MDIKIKRNELDIILTDMLPNELNEAFTLDNFYQFLFENRSKLSKIEKEILRLKSTPSIIFDGWHAMPLKYNIKKNMNDYRQLSILNPFSIIQVYLFTKFYSNDLLLRLSDTNCYSLRYHTKNSNLFYKHKLQGVVEYTNENFGKKFLESSGLFYSIKPFHRLTSFFNSDNWFILNSKFNYFSKIDYKNCFDSIYTHTYKWIISANSIDSKNYKNNQLLSVIDRLMQNINSSISNGIIVGPEFSRMIAEILLQQIDYEVCNKLLINDIKQNKDYEIFRYVDDIFIFTYSEDVLKEIQNEYKKTAKIYQLNLNDNKNIQGRLPYIWSSWKSDIKKLIETMESKFFYSKKDNSEYLIKTKNFLRLRILAVVKEEFQEIIARYMDETDKILAYIFGTFSNKILKSRTKKFRVDITTEEVEGFLDLIVYFYSFFPNFKNTQILISIIYIIKKEIKTINVNNILREVIIKYEYIFYKANIFDISNLILLFGLYEIELSSMVEEKLKNDIYLSSDPILYSIFLIYSQYNEKFHEEIKTDLNKELEAKLKLILRTDNILLYEEVWWLFIFFNCPFITESNRNLLNEKLELFKIINPQKTKGMCQNLLYDFLKSSQYPEKFIKWDLAIENLEKNLTFKTTERTLFKNEKFGDNFSEYF